MKARGCSLAEVRSSLAGMSFGRRQAARSLSPAPRFEPLPPPRPESLLRVNYFRWDGRHDQASLWVWDGHGRPQQHVAEPEVFPSGNDRHGVYFLIDLDRFASEPDRSGRIGFIPRLKQSWRHKDGPDRYWHSDMGQEIWLIGEDRMIYSEPPDLSPRVLKAFADGPRKLVATLSHAIVVADAAPATFSVMEPATGTVLEVAGVRALHPHDGKAASFEVELADDPGDRLARLELSAEDFCARRVELRGVLMDAERYSTDAPLGAIYTPTATTFRIFSPAAIRMRAFVSPSRTQEGTVREIALAPTGKGLWEARIDGDLEGHFYRVQATTPSGELPVVADPWATCTTGDDAPARITDLRRLDPPGFRPVRRPFSGRPTDAVIYELHVRDFSSHKSSGSKHPGKYLAFTERGLTLEGHPDLKTGIDHLVELGVTHVQMLPIQDHDNHEASPRYNWGYMTAFFNSPEGSYASDYRDASRVAEFKRLVQALHEAGIAVIMDVVYNHTGTQNTFERVAPGYFHRLREDGSFWNGSGCGNEFHSEAPMARRYILDSCRFWVEEYGVDGFRFDLMGLVDLETMRQLRRDLLAIDPHMLVYGEPWCADQTPLSPVTDKHAVRGTGIAAFNDHFRNALKGEPDGGGAGYVQNGSRRDGVKGGMAGSIADWTASPCESINYATCHDNLTLWDKLAVSTHGASEEDRVRMQILTGGILAVSQGILFLHGGADFARSKGGHHNSYDAGDGVNGIDWSRKATYRRVFEFHRGMIALRKAHPVFRLDSAEEIQRRLRFRDDILPAPNAIVLALDPQGVSGESWRSACVLVNPDGEPRTFALPIADPAKVYALGDKAGAAPIGEATGKLEVPARSMAVVAWN